MRLVFAAIRVLDLGELRGCRPETTGFGREIVQNLACVVDSAGHVIASQRMDGAALGALRLAVGKAYTAALWGMRTGDFTESTQPGGADWGWNTTDPRVVVYAGGIPLLVDGQLVGGLGASGGAADEDEACVVVAAEALGFG